MHVSRVEVERFRGLRKVGVSLQSPLQVVAGPNNAGKTTLLKAIESFFQGGTECDPSEIAPRNQYYKDESARALIKVRVHFAGLTMGEQEQFADAYLPRMRSFWCERRVSRTGAVSYTASKGATGVFERLASLYELIHVPAVRIGQGELVESESRRLTTAVSEVLVRTRPGPRTKLQKRFEEALERVDEIIREVMEESRDAAAALVPPGSTLQFGLQGHRAVLENLLSDLRITTDQDSQILLADEGTGFQSLLSMGLLKYATGQLAAARKRLLVLVEEPEAYLHPQHQRSVAAHLQDLSKVAQLVVTSHSPTIMDSVRIDQIARLPRSGDGLECDWASPELDGHAVGLLGRFCNSQNSELIFADSLIFCEGLTDVGVVRAIIEHAAGERVLTLNVAVVDMGSKDTAHHFARLANVFQLPFLIVLDKDCYSGTKRDVLRNLARVADTQLSKADYRALDRAKGTECASRKDASDVRKEANRVLVRLKVHSLASDMEGCVATSIPKDDLLPILGPGKLGHLSDESVDELASLSDSQYVARLFPLLGSKGWNTAPGGSANKPKPHVLPDVVRQLFASRTNGSDLDTLARRVKQHLGL